MQEFLVNKTTSLKEQNGHCNSDDWVLWEAKNIIKEVTALLTVIDLSSHKLNGPMSIVLEMGELLQSQIDPDNPLVLDLTKIVEYIIDLSG